MSRAVFFATAVLAAPAAAETRYFSELIDVPMPPAFVEINTAVGFESADGRLVVADATGAETVAEVRAFYAESLPPLGWSPSPSNDGAMVFVRGRERLLLEVSQTGARTHLHLQLVVRPAPSDSD